jgi:hypothetical protein
MILGYGVLGMLIAAIALLTYLRNGDIERHPEAYTDDSDYGVGGW